MFVLTLTRASALIHEFMFQNQRIDFVFVGICGIALDAKNGVI